MKKNKKLNAELVEVQERVFALEHKAAEVADEKNLLQEEMVAELDKIKESTARLSCTTLRCRHSTIKEG